MDPRYRILREYEGFSETFSFNAQECGSNKLGLSAAIKLVAISQQAGIVAVTLE